MLKKVINWAKGVWIAILGRQMFYTDQRDWSICYGNGTEEIEGVTV